MPQSQRPQSFSQLSRKLGITRKRVRSLVGDLGIASYFIGPSHVVDPEGVATLRRFLRRRRARLGSKKVQV